MIGWPQRTLGGALLLRLVLVAIGLLPWLLAGSGCKGALFTELYSATCHQLPERTLSLFGTPMVVCSRCAGVYLGVFLGAVLFLPARWEPITRWLFLGSMGLVVVDVVTQELGLHPPLHPIRLATGGLVGYFFAAYPLGLLHKEVRAEACHSRERPREVVPGTSP